MTHNTVADDVKAAVFKYEDTRPSRDGNCTGGLVGLAKFIARNFLKDATRWDEVYEFVKQRFQARHIVQRTIRGSVSYWPAKFAPQHDAPQKRHRAYAF